MPELGEWFFCAKVKRRDKLESADTWNVRVIKLGNDLIVDLNSDGAIDRQQDLTITSFFNSTAVGMGAIEQINDLNSSAIADYFAANPVPANPAVYSFFRSDLNTCFHTTSVAEKEAIIERLPNFD